EAASGSEGQFVTRRESQPLRPVEGGQDASGRRIGRIDIARGLDILRQSVVRRKCQAVRVALLNGDLQRVIPDAAHVQIVFGNAGELGEWAQQLASRYGRTVDCGPRQQALERVRYLLIKVVGVAALARITQPEIGDGQGVDRIVHQRRDRPRADV